MVILTESIKKFSETEMIVFNYFKWTAFLILSDSPFKEGQTSPFKPLSD